MTPRQMLAVTSVGLWILVLVIGAVSLLRLFVVG